jgi:hypothetical protein
VGTIKALAESRPEPLALVLAQANERVGLLRTPPSAVVVGRWIQKARTVPPLMS